MNESHRPSIFAVLAIVTAAAGCVGSGAEVAEILDEERPLGGDKNAANLPGHISGVVIDSELLPVPEVDIVVTPGQHVVLSDVDGTFVVGPLEPGEYVVTAQKRGYSTKEVKVNVDDDKPTTVRVSLEATGLDVPYHETLTRVMFLYCAVSIHVGDAAVGFYQTTVPCAGLADIVLQTATGQSTTNTLDTWTFDFVIDKTGFQSLVMEMVWPPQQFGNDGLMQLSELATAEAAADSGVTVGGTVYGGSMAQPYHDLIHAGNSYWVSGGENVTFYPTPNETKSFQMLIAGYYGNTSVPAGDSAVFINFKPTVYLTFFYNRQAAPEFSILPPD